MHKNTHSDKVAGAIIFQAYKSFSSIFFLEK